MNTTRWWQYVESVTEGATGIEIARHSGFDPSAISRWKRGDRPDVLFVIKFARAYGRNVLEALAEAGFITTDEANLHAVQVGVKDLGTLDILDELRRRAEAGQIPATRTSDPVSKVSHIRRVADMSVEELENLPHAAYDDKDKPYA